MREAPPGIAIHSKQQSFHAKVSVVGTTLDVQDVAFQFCDQPHLFYDEMGETPFSFAIRSSEAPLGMAIQLEQLSIPNCMCLVHPLSMFMMLLFNFATKQIYSMTRRAKRTLGIAIESKQPCIRSYGVLLYSFSMLQMLICNFTAKQMFTVTRRTCIYHRSAFPIAIRRADMNSSILDFQVVEFRFYDTTCFALFSSLY